MEIGALRPDDDRSAFACGDADLDRFLTKYAGQNQFRHHLGTTYVAVENDRIVGFATVAAGQLEGETIVASLRRRLPAYPLPILLARLAVDRSAKGTGVGRALLRFVFGLAVRMSADLGCVGVVVDAKPGAVEFYASFGFEALETAEGDLESRPRPQPMFLPLDLVLAVVGRADR